MRADGCMFCFGSLSFFLLFFPSSSPHLLPPSLSSPPFTSFSFLPTCHPLPFPLLLLLHPFPSTHLPLTYVSPCLLSFPSFLFLLLLSLSPLLIASLFPLLFPLYLLWFPSCSCSSPFKSPSLLLFTPFSSSHLSYFLFLSSPPPFPFSTFSPPFFVPSFLLLLSSFFLSPPLLPLAS